MKKWLLNIIPKRFRNVQKYDKIYHAFYGSVFFTILLLLGFEITICCLMTVIFGLLTEVRDEYKTKGSFDYKDAIATFILPLTFTTIKLFL